MPDHGTPHPSAPSPHRSIHAIPPPTVWLTAPANGTIISVNTKLAAPVEPTDSLAEIADLNTIYLIATLPQATAGKIKQGTQARIHFPIRPDKQYTATLLKFAACGNQDPACALSQDVSTRSQNHEVADLNTAGVVFTIANPDNQLRPGMNAECSIIMENRAAVLSVPREAIHGGPANLHVYVKHTTIPNAFDRVSVQTGLATNEYVEILDGLVSSTLLDFADGDHDHSHKHDDHSKIVKGPNNGHVITSKAGFTLEVSVDKQRNTRIVFLDKTNKPVALGEQTITGIAGERSAPSKLTFAKGKDADANVLISDKPLPAGDHLPIILTIKTSPDAKPTTERFELHLH